MNAIKLDRRIRQGHQGLKDSIMISIMKPLNPLVTTAIYFMIIHVYNLDSKNWIGRSKSPPSTLECTHLDSNIRTNSKSDPMT